MAMAVAARASLAAGLLLLSGLAAADVLVSASGDRLQGRLLERRDGVLVFESDLLGRIEVSEQRARVEPDPAAETIVAASPAAPAPDTAESPDAAPDAAPDAKATRWSTDLSVRLAVDRGSLETPEEDLRVALRGTRPTRKGVLTTGIDRRHRRTDDVLRDDDWRLESSYERFLGDEHFVAGRALATRELNSGHDDQTYAALAAAGWRLWEGEKQHLRIGPALGYLGATRSQGQFDSGALGLYVTAEGPVWAKLRFGGEAVVLDSLGDGRYAYLELRMRQPLGDRLYLALVWNYAWSDFDIEPGVRSEWRWDLGWRFGPDANR
jgi:hypothetical protein